MNKNKLSFKLLITFLLVGILPASIIALVSLTTATKSLINAEHQKLNSLKDTKKRQIEMLLTNYKNNLNMLLNTVSTYKKDELNNLESLHKSKMTSINSFFDSIQDEIDFLERESDFVDFLSELEKYNSKAHNIHGLDFQAKGYTNIRDKHLDFMENLILHNKYNAVYVIDKRSHNLIYSSNEGNSNINLKYHEHFLKEIWEEGTKNSGYSYADYNLDTDNFYLAKTTYLKDDEVLVVLAYNKTLLNDILQKNFGYGTTGETYLIGKKGRNYEFRSDMLTMGDGQYTLGFSQIGVVPDYWQDIYQKDSIKSVYTDSAGKLVMIVGDRYTKGSLNWAVVTKIDFEEAIDKKTEKNNINIYENFIDQYNFKDLALIHPSGDIFYSVKKGMEYHTNILTGPYKDSGLGHLVEKTLKTKGTNFEDFDYYEPAGNKKMGFMAIPFINNDKVEFIIAIRISIDEISQLVEDIHEMNYGSDAYILGSDFLPRSNIKKYDIDFDSYKNKITNEYIKKAANDIESSVTGNDFSDHKVIAVYTPLQIDNTKWVLVLERDYNKALKSVNLLIVTVAGVAVITLFAVVFIAIKTSKNISDPINKLSKWAYMLSKGDSETLAVRNDIEEINVLAESFKSLSKNFDDIEYICTNISQGIFDKKFVIRGNKDQLGKSLNIMRDKFITVINKAEKISQGDYSTVINVESDKDQLGKALVNMTASLKSAQEENEIQNFLKTGQSVISQVLQGTRETEILPKELIRALCNYLELPIGTLFIKNKHEQYKLSASYAYTTRKNHIDTIEKGQGLAGQCLVEKELMIIQNIPEDYLTIDSSLGSDPVKTLAILPCIYQEEVVAVIELGSLRDFEPQEITLLKLISESIAIGIHTNQTRRDVEELLEKTLLQAQELQQQQEELRQTNEELEEQTKSLRASEAILQQQQEELRVTNEELEEQTEVLKESEAKLQAQQEELRVINEELEERTENLEEQKRLINKNNERLQKAQEEIIKKARDLEVASKYKSEFLANMSHELRTPLNSILILSQLLLENKKSNLNDNQVEYAKTINSSGTDLLNLINDILDLSKVEAGKMSVNVDNINIGEFLTNLQRTFTPVADNKGLVFNIKSDSALPEYIKTDEQRLNQIIKNLLSNALKFTEEGSVTVETFAPEKELLKNEELKSMDLIGFKVKDTGIGISKDKLNLIFEAFQQADGTTSRKFGGTGLGLSISKELANLLGGELIISSELDKGSEFSIILPVNYSKKDTEIREFSASTFLKESLEIDSDPQEETKEKNRGTAASEVSLERETEVSEIKSPEGKIVPETEETTPIPEKDYIMIVEDDLNFSQVLKNLAAEKGFESVVCHSGEDALKLLGRSKPKALLLDLGLPGISGWDVLEQIRQNKSLKDLPVHIMTGMDIDEKIKQLGFVDYFKKPISIEKIKGVFEKIESFTSKDIKRILVVEDNKVHSDSIKAYLEEHNEELEVVSCSSGRETLDLLNTNKFDSMILDLGLKDISGIDLITKIRMEDISQIPVIIYTGKDLTKEENEKLEKYAETVILKGPESMNRLVDEANLFLHHIDNIIAEKKERTLQSEYNKEGSLVNKSVLVVDDDIRNIFALSSILESKGIKVEVARNGIEAIEKLEEKEEIDLVLMDIMMPEMDGYTAIRSIRKKPHWQDLPIIALTAKAMKEDRDKCISVGANDYMSKPVQVDKLLSLMRVWLY